MAAEFDRTAGRDSLMISKHLSGLVLAVLVAVPAQAAELRLTIQGVRSDAGELLIGLYASPDGFACALANASKSGLVADKGRLVGLSIRANAGAQSTVFTQLPPGRYAAVVIPGVSEAIDAGDERRTEQQISGLAGALLGAAFLIRMVADAGTGLHWLVWASPLGWIDPFGLVA